MSDITFGGLSSGLPTDEILESLMSVERIPLENLEAAQEEEAQKLAGYKEYDDLLEELRSTVASMNDTSEVRSTEATVGDEDLISATSTGAVTGSYEIAVEQLAQVQKTVTNGVSSQTEALFGEGSLTIGDTEITIDDENNTLKGIMASINAQSEETGVTASIINDGSTEDNYHLVLTGKDASTSFDFTTTDLDINFDNTVEDGGASNISEAQQAIAYIDGVKIVSDNNTLKDNLSGVSIDLKTVSETEDDGSLATTTLTIEPNTESLKENITDFVAAYNDIMEWIVSGYESEDTSVTTSTDEDGEEETTYTDNTLSTLLRGDSSINTVKRGLQSLLSSAVDSSSTYNILGEIGIQTQQDGTLYINSTTLDNAIEDNFDEVVNLMAGSSTESGVMDNFNTYLIQQTSSTQGMYALKEDSYDITIASLDTQIERKESMLESVEARYSAQFVALETLISGMNTESSFLTSFFSSYS